MNMTLRQASTGLAPGYMTGFGNGFETEALPGALPIGRNSPQRCPYGLYAEQISGSPFTAPRATNERSWLYRIRPTVKHWGRFQPADSRLWQTAPAAAPAMAPAPLRWDPLPLPTTPTSFIEGMQTITTAGDAAAQSGMATHVYGATRSMQDEYFYNADGELLLVPQQGSLRLCTEFGVIDIEPGRDRHHPPRHQIPRRTPRRPGPRLCLRKLRRCLHFAGTRPDRCQLPRQPARLHGPDGCLRGPRDPLPPHRQMGRRVLDRGNRPIPAGCRRLARQLRAL